MTEKPSAELKEFWKFLEDNKDDIQSQCDDVFRQQTPEQLDALIEIARGEIKERPDLAEMYQEMIANFEAMKRPIT